MQNNPLVSIVIPTYNRKKSAERLIRSLLNSTYKELEIIVIDDATKDRTFEYLSSKFKKNKKVKVFRNKKNLFAAGSKNMGQRKAKGEFIAFIDDDNVVDKNMIKILVSIFLKNPDIGEAGPVNYNFNNKKQILLTRSTRSMWTTKTSQLRTLGPFKNKSVWNTDDIPNAFMVRGEVVRKNKIEFRPQYGIMYEESDYAYRIRKAGYKVIMVREAKIYHDIENSSVNGKPKDYLYHFMKDKRRPFTFARNRIIFHSLFSTKLQNVFILTFWIWLFTAYYIYMFSFYNRYGRFTFYDKLRTGLSYLKGTFVGIFYVFSFHKLKS